jgi:hypothetical protein
MNPIRTVEDLIEVIMARVKVRFYHNRPAREWATDRNALLKAVMRYGYECTGRGWRFEADVLAVRLLDLLNKIERPTTPGWFPIYLETAVDQHVRERAEEIQEAAAQTEVILAKVRAGLPVTTAARPPVASEMAAAVFLELKRRQTEKAEQLRLDREVKASEPDLFAAGKQRRREGAGARR